MGVLRTLLALVVVLDHAWPAGSVFVGGPNAVQCFYVISGFLISYVLVERRSYSSVGAFYVNRYLRLYPIYIVIASLTLLAVLVTHRSNLLYVYQHAPLSAVCVLIFTNLLLLGQDWIMFLAVQDHSLVFTANFRDSEVYLFEGQLIHPSWTLGLELTFYLVAPFVLTRRPLLWALLVGSIGLRALFIARGFGLRDPWSYRFFPTELALFLSGALAHQILLPAYQRLAAPIRERLVKGGMLAILALVVGYALLPLAEIYRKPLLLGCVVSVIPLAFMFQLRHRVDSWIGDLSYPIYICHTLVLDLTHFALRHTAALDSRLSAVVCVALTIGAAVLLNHYIAEPVEKLRKALKMRDREAERRDPLQTLPAARPATVQN